MPRNRTDDGEVGPRRRPARGTACWKCGKPMARASAAVQFWENVWLPRVGAMVCRPCVCAQLTPAGKAKVDRTVAGVKAMGLVAWTRFEPSQIEILDRSDGTKMTVRLTSARR